MKASPLERRNTISSFALCVLLAVSINELHSQPRSERSFFGSYHDAIHAEVLTGIGSAGDSVAVIIRVGHEFMVFTRSNKPNSDSAFHAGAEATIEARSKDGKLVATHFAKGGQYAKDEGGSQHDLFLTRTFSLPHGQYEVTLIIKDRESSRESMLRGNVTVKEQVNEHAVGMFVPVHAPSADANAVNVLCYGGALLFSTESAIAIPARVPERTTWSFELRTQRKDAWITVIEGTMQPSHIFPGFALTEGKSGFAFKRTDGNGQSLYIFKLPFDTLSYGVYSLSVRASSEAGKDSSVETLHVLWLEQPRSLRIHELALRLLNYIMTEDEIDWIGSGSLEERWGKFEQFWKQRDPSPGTVYNEHLAEFYRRADEANKLYETLENPFGALSDQGKIHILHGKPEFVRRSLERGNTRETWHYPSLNRTFVFEDQNGTMKLLPSDDTTQ